MNVLFAFYRDWVWPVWDTIVPILTSEGGKYARVTTPEQLADKSREDWDVIILIGWSWRVPADIVNSKIVIGMHPSDLPDYAGGSPIQNQILDGIELTKATLFRLNEKFDAGEIIDKEPIDLRGHLVDVLKNIATATAQMVLRFIEQFPNNQYVPQIKEKHVVRRLKPEHSRLLNPLVQVPEPSPHALKAMSCKEMWNHIRCREDPYPNAYFEDETGKLIIKHVEFQPK